MKKLRIISGILKSRKLLFPCTIKELRPTCDRVRETLFNWLMADIADSNCLDAFAGSGALGFEAISRGAKHCVFIEKSKIAVKALQENKDNLGIDNIDIIQADALRYLRNYTDYNIIFLDPPFTTKLLVDALNIIYSNVNIGADTLIYIESSRSLNLEVIMPRFTVLKHSIYGDVLFAIVKGRERA